MSVNKQVANFLVRYVKSLKNVEQVERRTMLEKGVQEGLKIPDIINTTNALFSRATILKNPITYSVSGITEVIDNLVLNKTMEMEETPVRKERKKREKQNVKFADTPTIAPTGPVTMVERHTPTAMGTASDTIVIANEEVVVFDPESINAANDPSISSFIKTKSFNEVERLMTQKHPVNVYIFGETGVGKTASVLVVAKKQKRIVVRVNCSFFTDVDDLIGGIRIENGNTIVHKGPALMAMELGAILLLDEIDRLNPQLANEIFPILEGKGYLIKKLNKMIYPSHGFCVIGTGNSKGRGDMTGNYNTQILDKALLDRFPVAVEYESPETDEMETILKGQNLDIGDSLVSALSRWYGQIHTAFKHGAVTDIISTRRLIDIAKAMDNAGIDDPNHSRVKKSLKDATVLMDADIGSAFIELWGTMLDSPVKTSP